jgi:hypothetical protein
VIKHVEPGESLRLATAHEVFCCEGYAESMIREMCETLAARITGGRVWGQGMGIRMAEQLQGRSAGALCKRFPYTPN